MPLPGSDTEGLLIRHTALSVIVQGLMDTMLAKSLLLPEDLSAIRRYATDLSRDLISATSVDARAAAVRLGDEVEAFMQVVAGQPLGSDAGDKTG